MEIVKVLLVEDDMILSQEIKDEIETRKEEFDLVGLTDDSSVAVEYVKKYCPDVVILDLELHNGGGSGLDFLNAIYNNRMVKPFILVTTNNISTVTHSIARNLGADFIFTKNQKDYSAKMVLDFISITKSSILEKRGAVKTNGSDTQIEVQTKQLTQNICKRLDNLGISPRAVGYNYLADAILMIINDNTQHLYEQIGRKYSKTPSSVERAMQNAINQTWFSANINDLLKQYKARIKSEKGVPTITEFIYYYAREIKNSF